MGLGFTRTSEETELGRSKNEGTESLEEEVREDMPTLTKDSECEQGTEGVRGWLCRHMRRQFHSVERFRGTEKWG